MNQGGTRAKCHAVARRLDRGVMPRRRLVTSVARIALQQLPDYRRIEVRILDDAQAVAEWVLDCSDLDAVTHFGDWL